MCLGHAHVSMLWVTYMQGPMQVSYLDTWFCRVNARPKFAQFTHPHQACVQGYALGTLSAFLSALAAVYTEWVMKRTSDSLYWQNMQLYSFGVVFNALGLTIGDVRSGTGLLSLHGGFPGSYPCSCLQ